MKKRHELRLIGITYNQIESGVYAVILEEVKGDRRIPIVIGYPEAQAIECKLQEVRTPRPLTHDLIKNIMDVFHIELKCVDIHKLSSGVFAADLVIIGSDGELHKIDSRSSDAIALAIRTGAPIYTTADVLDECGFRPKGRSAAADTITSASAESLLRASLDEYSADSSIESFDALERLIVSDEVSEDGNTDAEILDFLANYSDKEIENQISKFAAEEKYEVAARLKALIRKRNNTEK